MHVGQLVRGLGAAIVAIGVALTPTRAEAQCSSPNPADWPPPAKPYFMMITDTSGSMTACTTPPTAYPTECNQNAAGYALNSCSMIPSRINDAKCALRQTVQAFSGEVNFGLATYAQTLTNCGTGACVSDCGAPTGGTCNGDNYACTQGNYPGGNSCGNVPFCNNGGSPPAPAFPESTWRNGANVVVPLRPDPIGGPPAPDNTNQLLEWFDGQCNNNRELFANGSTPIAGSLESIAMYLRLGWRIWDDNGNSPAADAYCGPLSYTQPTPMVAADPACRPLNVILVTDGDDTCEGTAANGLALSIAAAQDLFQNGVTIGGTTWPVRVYVINFAGGTQANTDQIAAAGGTGSSLFAANEVELAQALSGIIAGAIAPEECNNGDDNCNGCVDEGYTHYCNVGQTCCVWNNDTQRDACFNDPATGYFASITPADPDGDLTRLPCTTVGQQADPNYWLCFNPGDQCDNTDNNCVSGVDEGQLKCGNPLACPTTEVCDGVDNDCDGLVNEGGVCGTCVVSAEVCDGCDNDCDGIIDDGIAPIACGLPTPANCAGTKACTLSGTPVAPGGCMSPGGFGPCNNNPQTEVCDSVDNDCDGIVDDGIAPVPCVPSGTPPGLNYGANSTCKMGTQACGGACIGFIGPQAEICDNIDNDCDFSVDEAPLPGVGQQCGVSTPPCTPGITACVNGSVTCQGGVQPTGEICDGIDNNCNGQADEAPLSDAPLPGQTGCWNQPGNCCSHGSLTWCPPPGGTCNGVGTLVSPCSTGTLQCAGAGGWVCQGGTNPAGEVCDGVDNDCDGTPDDGSFPGEGMPCQFNAPQNPTPLGCTPGDCAQGVIDCQGGFLDCVGGVGPGLEVCNNKDDNCDGICDNGIPIGAECLPAYDMAAYPDTDFDLAGTPCLKGFLQCDGMGGLVCVNGVGPTPEVCDGLDNDCDGQNNEAGPAPNGIDGTADPNDPTHVLGDPCTGGLMNVCAPGTYVCLNSLVQCAGIDTGEPESCDCSDQDCNGVTDNQNPNNSPPLCSPGKDCVNANGNCQCAQPCTGEFCPSGQVCTDVVSSETGNPLGKYCITDTCGDCATKTVVDANQNILCAPAGTMGADCNDPPVCVCKGQNGCQPPCFGVSCNAPQVCTNFGPNAGQCNENNCFNLGCPGCETVCNDLGQCLPNPCANANCAADEACKPSDDFLSFSCLPSCATVMCERGTVCKDGACVPTCVPPCPQGETCDLSQSPPACVDDACDGNAFCPNGACCDPITGACGACPCEGVVCPEGQHCEDGECALDTMGQGGGATGATTGTGPGATGATTGAGGSTGEGGADGKGVWGLATGGGGCSCESAGRSGGGEGWLLFGVAAFFARFRPRSRRGAEVSR